MRAYAQGSFVNRFGTTMAQPGVSAAGIPDAAITGATTVLFEAVFDFLDRTPIVMDQAWKPTDAKQPKFTKLWGAALPAGTSLPTALTPMKQSGKNVIYGSIQTIATITDDTPVAGKLICGITERKARAITTLATYFGHRMVVWGGIAGEALSSINIDFIIGSSFAVGDNKTLVSMFKAAVEVIGRRSAERILFRILYAVPEKDFGDLMEFFPANPTPAAKAKA
jgi:hypothetical protein